MVLLQHLWTGHQEELWQPRRCAQKVATSCKETKKKVFKSTLNARKSLCVWKNLYKVHEYAQAQFNCYVKQHFERIFMMTIYLSGPQRVRPKNPRREMTQLKTACFNNFIHCKENRWKEKRLYYGELVILKNTLLTLLKTSTLSWI